VTYRVEFEGDALVRLNGLPEDAFDALVNRIVALTREPWDASEVTPGDEAPYREAFFGDYGIVSFRVDDSAELIRIFGIVWAG
jgi:hypothetical protein